MVRMYKIGENGRPMTGESLVKLAMSSYKNDAHGVSRYGKPTTVKKALWWFGHEVRRTVLTKTESEDKWKYA